MKKNMRNAISGLFLFIVCSLSAQQIVNGTVTDELGAPLPGATISVIGTNDGTTTDFDGNYSITTSNGVELQISYIGYQKQNILVSDEAEFSVSLQPDNELSEVVVTALGLSREKKSLGYSVSEISGDQINTIKDYNIANSLVGKVPGLNITQSGAMGSGSRITIRGNNSLSGNTQALIVVDGVPINADGINTGGDVYESNVSGGGISDINPNDVETISVLKGPNAAALYGSRAGNGVILITTKRGSQDGKLGVTINTNLTFDDPMFLPDFQNSYGQGTFAAAGTDLVGDWSINSWGSRLDGSQKLYYDGTTKPYSAQPNNVSDFFRTATKAVTSISIDKGSEESSLRFSYTNNSSEATLENSNLNSHNFNLRGTAQLSDKLSIDTKATFFTQNVKNRASVAGQGPIGPAFLMPRNVAIDDLRTYQGQESAVLSDFNVISYGQSGDNTANPFWQLYNDEKDEDRSRFFGFAKINYQFNDWLNAFIRVGSDLTNLNRMTLDKPGHHFYKGGRLGKSKIAYGELNSEFLITANKDLTEKFNIVVNAGGNLSKRTSESITNFGQNFKIPTKYFLSNLSDMTPPDDQPQAVKKVNSLYGSASLSYNSFLYLDITARNDWSSTLGEDNRSFLYNSASLSVILNKFIDPEQNIFNLIKIRGSLAQVGNDTDPYQLNQTFSVPGAGFRGLTTLSAPTVKLNPDLKPETVTSNEFGLEFAALNNRLSVDFSIYNIVTTDLIFNVPVPAATGFSFFKENIGEVSNSGIELSISATPIETANFVWQSTLFYAANKNTLNKLTEGLESITYNVTNSGNATLRATVGGSIGDIYGTVWDTDVSGNNIVNANGIAIASNPDNLLGNAQPDWIGGWSNTFMFKGLSLSFLIDARIGGQIYADTGAALDGRGVSERSLLYRETGVTLDAIDTSTNSKNTSQITGQEYWNTYSTIAENYVYEQDNVRLRELALGYQFNDLSKIGIDRASIQLIGRNLFFLSKSAPNDFDPESMLGTSLTGVGFNSFNMPTLRSLGLNLTLNF
tara:strand:+ start:411 stop:3488 length:3078 start_codon:yes stop_codon:yes gene_type:complete